MRTQEANRVIKLSVKKVLAGKSLDKRFAMALAKLFQRQLLKRDKSKYHENSISYIAKFSYRSNTLISGFNAINSVNFDLDVSELSWLYKAYSLGDLAIYDTGMYTKDSLKFYHWFFGYVLDHQILKITVDI